MHRREILSASLGTAGAMALGPAFWTPALAAPGSGYRLPGPYTHRILSIYLIHRDGRNAGPAPTTPVPMTLREALEQGTVKILETGNVRQLVVRNVGGREVFIQAGDIVKGGKQDRGPARAAGTARPAEPRKTSPGPSAAEHKRQQVEARRQQRRLDGLRKRIADLEGRIAEREEAIRKLEADMAAPGFFTDQTSADEAIKRHQALMWEVGDLMNQWEALEQEAAAQALPS